MILYFNGRFVPEEMATISVFDRGFLYGDGLFEAVRLYEGQPFLWKAHMHRFSAGAEMLGIRPPLSPKEMFQVVRLLASRTGDVNSIARITLSRGVGLRGYSPRGAEHPTFVISLHPLPEKLPPSCKVVTSSIKLPENDPLAFFKHSNKLHQIIAKIEADAASTNEALLLNSRGFVVEGTTTNLFWFENKTLCTPPLQSGILEGTTRGYVLRLAKSLGMKTSEKNIHPNALMMRAGVFLTSCGIEIMEISAINGKTVRRSPSVALLKRNYRKRIEPLV